MKRALTLLLSLFLIAYPLMVYFGLSRVGAPTLFAALLVLTLVRSYVARTTPVLVRFGPLALLLAIAALGLSGGVDSALLVRLYPAVVSFAFLILFAHSFYHPPTIAERFARLSRRELSESAIQYCRKVTRAWCLIFLMNGSIALWTALFSSLEVWTLFNGLISYIIVAVCMVTEYVIRLRHIAHEERRPY